MLQGNISDLILFITIAFIAVGFTVGCYAIFSIGIDIWEKITGNTLGKNHPEWLPWHDKES